jgi:tetratricopeptide (TPR) repeat protein
MLRLGRQNLDIPAGESQYRSTDSFVLPVDVEVHAVQPHAHYLAREVRGTARLPDGRVQPLIYVRDWDFRWQQFYRYATPFTLPKGTTLSMEFVFDNSAANPRNPSRPPKRVGWGQRSADEMGDLWIQVLTKDANDLATLTAAFRPKVLAEDVIGYEARIKAEPGSAALHDDAALLYLELGRPQEAVRHFGAAAAMKPESAAAHFNLGTALAFAGRVEDAIARYERALALRPDYGIAHNNLGGVLFRLGRLDRAERHLTEAVRLDPANAEAHDNLGRLYSERRQPARAVDEFRAAASLRPEWATPHAELAWLLATTEDRTVRDPQTALQFAMRAAVLTGRRDPLVLDVLAAAHAAAGDFDRAAATAQAALDLATGPLATGIRERLDAYRRRQPVLVR